MNSLLVTIFILSIVSSCYSVPPYRAKYDNVNIEDILRNERILNGYIRCLLDQGKCTQDGLELKRSIPDALTTRCRSCTMPQKAGTTRIIAYLTANKPDVWRALLVKYDPRGEYYKNLRRPL